MRKKYSRGGPDVDLQYEYVFSAGARRKYSERYVTGTNVVVLAPDVAEVFPDSESGNEALRVLAKLIRQRTDRTSA